ncbi:restriction endonuclease subunit S [Dyella sp. KRB-257]|uniref:restriction endonuclease subunit S n=1 Tax=Dyella sp. KRB-257 TaxID=3400915 RepID=UPI003C01C170
MSDSDALIESLEQLIAKKRQIKQGTMQVLLTGKQRLPGFAGRWERVRAGDVGSFRGGNGFPIAFQGDVLGDYPFFKVSDMNNDGNETFMSNSNNWISERAKRRLGATVFPEGSIIFAKVGAAVFLERKKILAKPSCIDNNLAAFVLDRSRAEIRFVHHALLETKFGSLVSTTALPSLNGAVLSQIPLELPPLAEQEAIAEFLSDMDTELAELETRLAKTRQLKQGMMQELLTGRIRLV